MEAADADSEDANGDKIVPGGGKERAGINSGGGEELAGHCGDAHSKRPAAGVSSTLKVPDCNVGQECPGGGGRVNKVAPDPAGGDEAPADAASNSHETVLRRIIADFQPNMQNIIFAK